MKIKKKLKKQKFNNKIFLKVKKRMFKQIIKKFKFKNKKLFRINKITNIMTIL